MDPLGLLSSEIPVDQLVQVVNLANEHERLQWREKLGEVLSEKTLYVSEVILQISTKKKFGLENTKHSRCPGYFFVIVKLFIESLSNLCMNHKYFLEITLYPLCVRTCFCKKVILYHR